MMILPGGAKEYDNPREVSKVGDKKGQITVARTWANLVYACLVGLWTSYFWHLTAIPHPNPRLGPTEFPAGFAG